VVGLDREQYFLANQLSFETVQIRAFGPLVQLHLLVVGRPDLQLVDLLHVELGRLDDAG
jgi:hypothetical protein